MDESEHHTSADYYYALPDDDKKKLAVWGGALLSLTPYLFLFAPIGLLIPFAGWILAGGE